LARACAVDINTLATALEIRLIQQIVDESLKNADYETEVYGKYD